MDSHTLDKLQFAEIRTILSGLCSSSLGCGLAARIEPSKSIDMVRRWLDQVRELQRVSEDIGLPPLGSIGDIRDSVRAAGTPAGLDAETLSRVAVALEATGLLCSWGGKLPEDSPLLRGLIARVGDFRPVSDRIQESVDPRGNVLDHASEKLRSIRAIIDRARGRIDIVFSRLIRQPSITRLLQYGNPTFHNDRKVLPLKAEHRGRIPGIIHRSSDSGATLFVEPTEAVELNNAIIRLGMDAKKEIDRILRELSHLVYMNANEIVRTLDTVAVLDLLVAKVRYAREHDARVAEITTDGTLELWQARHPLLEAVLRGDGGSDADGDAERKVVPIDIRLGDDFDLLVITGPNTGGKTVALKTLGLLTLMTQAGIPIPVGPRPRVPVFKNVFVDVGDEQSIEQSLSTFSSHLSNLLDILNRAGRDSLVLIDELGAGTDPDEGAAIGRAIVQELLEIGAAGCITTHLSALKAVAYTEARVENACVEFDAETLRPMYNLRIGEPGNSNALFIAERLGMGQKMVQRARSYLDGRHQALTKAIAGTLDSRRRAEKARAEAADARLEAEKQSLEHARQAKALDEARLAHERWVAWINRLSRGDEVFVRSFERKGTIVRMQLQKQTALVSAGPIDFEVRLQELIPPDHPDAA